MLDSIEPKDDFSSNVEEQQGHYDPIQGYSVPQELVEQLKKLPQRCSSTLWGTLSAKEPEGARSMCLQLHQLVPVAGVPAINTRKSMAAFQLNSIYEH